MYNNNSQIKFKTVMLTSGLCCYSDAYVLVKGTIGITGKEAGQSARQTDEIDTEITFKNCVLLTDCISE